MVTVGGAAALLGLRRMPYRAAAPLPAHADPASRPAAAHGRRAAPRAPAKVLRDRVGRALVVALLAGAATAAGAPAELRPCRLRGLEHTARCGTLLRPVDARAADGRRIELHYAVLPALSRQRKPDPVFFFAGGPGQSAIDLAGTVAQLLARLAQRRDLVLIDQRGTGRSAPLHCAGDDDPLRPLRASLDATAAQHALELCRQALQALPYGDLRHFSTVDAARDAEAVRVALGAEHINLVGVSYGTRVALELLRQAPQSVRRVVLDGVAPPDMALPAAFARDAQAAFKAMLAWCQADTACRQRHPRLHAQWQALRASLPRQVTLTHPLSGRDESLTLTPDALDGLVRAPLYAPKLAAALPAAIAAAAAGRWSALVGLASTLGGARGGGIAQGEHFAVLCSEDLPLVAAAPAPQGDFSGLAARYGQACSTWPRADLPAAFRRLAPSPAPVLLLSGELDPVTPPRHAARVAAALGARTRHVVVAAGGHGQLALPCVREQVQRFIDADDDASAVAADGGCPAQRPRPPLFVAPAAPGAAEGTP